MFANFMAEFLCPRVAHTWANPDPQYPRGAALCRSQTLKFAVTAENPMHEKDFCSTGTNEAHWTRCADPFFAALSVLHLLLPQVRGCREGNRWQRWENPEPPPAAGDQWEHLRVLHLWQRGCSHFSSQTRWGSAQQTWPWEIKAKISLSEEKKTCVWGRS